MWKYVWMISWLLFRALQLRRILNAVLNGIRATEYDVSVDWNYMT
jgi:hypothetical protein